MRAGVAPVILEGHWMVPAHPEWFEVPTSSEAGVLLLIAGGEMEKCPEPARGPGGTFTSPAAQAAGQDAPRRGRPRGS
jgi:hypothetical protein